MKLDEITNVPAKISDPRNAERIIDNPVLFTVEMAHEIAARLADAEKTIQELQKRLDALEKKVGVNG